MMTDIKLSSCLIIGTISTRCSKFFGIRWITRRIRRTLSPYNLQRDTMENTRLSQGYFDVLKRSDISMINRAGVVR